MQPAFSHDTPIYASAVSRRVDRPDLPTSVAVCAGTVIIVVFPIPAPPETGSDPGARTSTEQRRPLKPSLPAGRPVSALADRPHDNQLSSE